MESRHSGAAPTAQYEFSFVQSHAACHNVKKRNSHLGLRATVAMSSTVRIPALKLKNRIA